MTWLMIRWMLLFVLCLGAAPVFALASASSEKAGATRTPTAARAAAAPLSKWQVTLGASPAKVQMNQRITFSGAVRTQSGKAGTGTVTIQKRPSSGGAWSTWKSATLSSQGGYALTVTMTTAQVSQVRARMPGNAANATGFSANKKVTVEAAAGTTLSVREFGAKGDGKKDDTAAIRAALKASVAKGRTLSFTTGTYRVSSLLLPARAKLAGAGAGRTWIKGRVEASGGDRLKDLMVGVAGSSFRFVNGARDVLFERVSFVGGGGSSDALIDSGVIRFHEGRRASFITFRACTIGRNSADGNGVTLVDRGRPDATYHDIVFERCHFLASPRMSFEAIQRPSGDEAITTGYHGIDLIGNVFDPAGSEAISYDADGGLAGHSLVSGNVIMGAGTNAAYQWGQGVEFNGVEGMRFVNNRVYRCRGAMINHQGVVGAVTDNTFTGNVFDSTVSHIKSKPSAWSGVIEFLNVNGSQFADNIVRTNVGGQQVVLYGSSDNGFARNELTDERPAPLARASAWLTANSLRNTFDGNRFEAANEWGTFCAYQGSDFNIVSNCTFVTHGGRALDLDPGLTLTLVNNTYR